MKIYIPKRFKGRVGYHIFVDRFNRDETVLQEIEGRRKKEWSDVIPDWWPDSDGEYRNEYFYCGNIKGIIEKLDYFLRLSVNLLYLSPISKTYTNHHYDVCNQLEIDSYIGSWDDYRTLCEEAHKRDILIAVDLVFNHMGSRSEFFKLAMQGDEYYRQWFEWDEKGNPIYWYGFKDMPQCDKSNKSYIEYARQVVRKYIQNGADCIRLDLGEILPKEFLLSIKEEAKTINPEVLIVSEMWDFAIRRINPQIYDGQVDSLMNYPLSDCICRWVRYGNYLHFNDYLDKISKYPIEVQDVLFNHLDTHDTPRLMNLLSGEGMIQDPYCGRIWDMENRVGAPWRLGTNFDTYVFRKWEFENDSRLDDNVIKRQKQAALMQYCIKGIPIIFYGTEAGVCGNKDPFNRKPYPWGVENTELIEYYVKLGEMRKTNYDVFSDGSMYVNVNDRCMEIIRNSVYGIIIAYINRSEDKIEIDANLPNSKIIFNIEGSSTQNYLLPYGGIVIRF